jgi:hypothetical protein
MTDQLDAVADREASQPQPEAEVEPSVGEYRYPGAPPFADSDMDRLLFRGRASEIDQVLHSILSFDLFLIYAISGLGKTSLLSAGVMEPLRERDYFPVLIRLNNPDRSPVDLIDEQLRQAASKVEGITIMRNPSVRDIEGPPSTLWDLLSRLEVWKGNTLQHLVLVFDQFEELFTLGWNNDQRAQFIEQFGQVVRRHRATPADLRADPATLLPPPAVKIVLIIREDFLGELEAMAQQVPQIMRHRFRLDGLVPAQAELAIREPARINDQRLATPQFAYSEGAAHAILAFLGARQDRGRPVLTQTIDPSQLQIICQHVERSILPKKSASDGAVVEISEDDLGGRTGLDRILSDFYRREIASFPSNQRKIVRNLCETGLINQRGRRLSLEEEEIGAKYKVSKSILEDLVAHRLLRAEPRVGSVYYELAHDTLAAPILAYRDGARKARRRHWLQALAAVAVVVALGLVIWRMSAETESAAGPSGTPISAEGARGGTIEGSDAETFVFDASEGQTLIVELAPAADNNLDEVQLQVTEPGGRHSDLIADENAQRVVVARTERGPYAIVVSGFGSGTVEFILSVRTVAPEAIEIGGSKLGTISTVNPFRTFTFQADAGEALIVGLKPRAGASLDTVQMQVTDPDHFVEDATFAASEGAQSVVLETTLNGVYVVVVSGYGSSNVGFELTVGTADAQDVPIGGSASGAVDASNPAALFTFEPPEGQTLLVELASTSGASLDTVQLQVTDPDGLAETTYFGASGGPQTAVTRKSVNGQYLVVVSGFGPRVGFDLSVRPADPLELALGSSMSGTIGGTGPIALFEVTPSFDQTLIVELAPKAVGENQNTLQLQVYDPLGSFSASYFGTTGGTQTALVERTVEGPYLVIVNGFASGAVRFDISARTTDATDLSIGEAASGSLDSANLFRLFTLDAPGDRTLSFELKAKPGSRLDSAQLQVTNPEGDTEIAEFSEGEVPQTVVIERTIPGPYIVVVSEYGSDEVDFELSVRSAPVAEMSSEGSTSGTVDSAVPVTVFEFVPPDDQQLMVELKPGDSLDVILQVTDLDTLSDVQDFGAEGGIETAVLDAKAGRRYRVFVSGYESTTGKFELSVHGTDAEKMTIGDTRSGFVDPSKPAAVFEFTAQDPQSFTVGVTPDEGLHAVLQVVDPSGVIHEATNYDDGGPLELEVNATLSGRYLIVVKGYISTAGRFDLTLA